MRPPAPARGAPLVQDLPAGPPDDARRPDGVLPRLPRRSARLPLRPRRRRFARRLPHGPLGARRHPPTARRRWPAGGPGRVDRGGMGRARHRQVEAPRRRGLLALPALDARVAARRRDRGRRRTARTLARAQAVPRPEQRDPDRCPSVYLFPPPHGSRQRCAGGCSFGGGSVGERVRGDTLSGGSGRQGLVLREALDDHGATTLTTTAATSLTAATRSASWRWCARLEREFHAVLRAVGDPACGTEIASLETRLIRWMVGMVIVDGHVDRRHPAPARAPAWPRAGGPRGTAARSPNEWRDARVSGWPGTSIRADFEAKVRGDTESILRKTTGNTGVFLASAG